MNIIIISSGKENKQTTKEYLEKLELEVMDAFAMK